MKHGDVIICGDRDKLLEYLRKLKRRGARKVAKQIIEAVKEKKCPR